MSNMSFPEMMYYAESEGLLPTRFGKINAFIKDINEHSRFSGEMDTKVVIDFLNLHNIKDLSVNEVEYINSKIKGVTFYI